MDERTSDLEQNELPSVEIPFNRLLFLYQVLKRLELELKKQGKITDSAELSDTITQQLSQAAKNVVLAQSAFTLTFHNILEHFSGGGEVMEELETGQIPNPLGRTDKISIPVDLKHKLVSTIQAIINLLADRDKDTEADSIDNWDSVRLGYLDQWAFEWLENWITATPAEQLPPDWEF